MREYRRGLGFVVLIPILNLAFMVRIVLRPSDGGRPMEASDRSGRPEGRSHAAALSVASGLIIGSIMVLTSIYLFRPYGASLFLGTPALMGATAAYFYNRANPHSFVASAGIGAAAVLLGFLAMLLFALEGVICLVMAAPMAVPIAALGGLLGKAIADASRRPLQELAAALLMLPVWAAGESWLAKRPSASC